MSLEALRGSRILVTGHTGFKGAWLSRLLNHLGASVCGISLTPENNSILANTSEIEFDVNTYADINDFEELKLRFNIINPDIVIHMAAQPLVRRSYTEPLLTFQTNVLGTANLLECVRLSAKTIGALVVTSDKVYRNLETGRAFIEEDELGGVDPYSASKSAAEMVVTAWREMPKLSTDKLIVSARAGNIIGGGDHAEDRLLPDLIRSFRRGLPAKIRSPKSIRPWQHVLDPIWGYCLLVNRILEGKNISNSYNFGPSVNYQYSVEQIAKWACQYWGDGASWIYESPLELLPESKLLSLNSSKANVELGWNPKLDTRRAVEWTVRWEKERTNANVLLAIDKQIQKYLELKS